ncbi:MAG: pyrroline-5-carboxylate reductase family protein, partial [Parazoarcus communis]
MKISFLGGGNMAAALIGGMVERGFAASDIQVVELDAANRERLEQRFGVRACAAPD